MTNVLDLINQLDAITEPLPKTEKPKSRRDRRKEARAAKVTHKK
jgi:hypothetical protein